MGDGSLSINHLTQAQSIKDLQKEKNKFDLEEPNFQEKQIDLEGNQTDYMVVNDPLADLKESPTDYLWIVDIEPTNDPSHGATKEQIEKNKKFFERKITHTPVTGALFEHDPKIDDINQQAIGDCWFLAALCSIVSLPNGPDIIQGMMLDTKDGYIAVRLYDQGLRARYIKVKRTLIEHSPLFYRKQVFHSGSAIWVAFLEKALTTFSSYGYFEPERATYANIMSNHSFEGFKRLLGINAKIDSVEGLMEYGYSLEKLNAVFKFCNQYAQYIEGNLMPLTNVLTLPVEIKKRDGQITEISGPVFVDMIGNDNRCIEEFIIQAGNSKLYTKWLLYYNYKSTHIALINSKEEEVKGAFRMEDFNDFMDCKLGDLQLSKDFLIFLKHLEKKGTMEDILNDWKTLNPRNFDISGINQFYRIKLMEWVEDSKTFPCKRWSGVYSLKQLEIFDKIKQCLDAHRPVCISTEKIVGRKIDAKGISGGEDISKGLAGGHAYAVINYGIDTGNIHYLLVVNPWMEVGRGYTDMIWEEITEFDGFELTVNPTKKGEKQIQKGKKAFDIDSGIFWLELSDLTKRANGISYCTEAVPAPVIQEQLQEQEPIVWTPNSHGECQLCNKKLGMFVKRHHCRKCGKLVCGDCSKDTLLLDGKEKRVCKVCYNQVYKK